MNSLFIYIILYIISQYHCNLGDLNGYIVKRLHITNKSLQKLKSSLDYYSFDDDPLLNAIYERETIKFISTAKTYKFYGVPLYDNFKLSLAIFSQCGIEPFPSDFLIKAMENNLFMTSYLGVFSIPNTNKAKFIAVVGERELIEERSNEWILIDFTEQFDFIEGYSYEMYYNYCPSTNLVCRSEEKITKKNKELSLLQREWIKTYMTVITTELLARTLLITG